MNQYDLRPNYDPNLLPQWQRPSIVEEKFVHLEQSLYAQETHSLLLGSAYRKADDKLLNDKIQALLKESNPLMLRYNFPHKPDFCHEDNLNYFSKMKKNLIDPLESTNPEQAVSLSWEIDCLAQDPYTALHS